MNNLEQWFNKTESVKAPSVQEKMSDKIWEILKAEGSIEQMIWDVPNERIRYSLEYFLKRKDSSIKSEKIKEEIAIYYNEIEPKLVDEELSNLFNRLVTKRIILPSSILREFEIRDEILAESNPEIKNIMVRLLNKVSPSIILPPVEIERQKSLNACKRLAAVINPDEKEIIERFLTEWSSPISIEEEYEYYVYIKNYEYKNDDLKNFVLSLINEGREEPSVIALFFDIFKDWKEFWEDDKKYIQLLINNWWI